jgi:phosphoribosylamine--glycine ligase
VKAVWKPRECVTVVMASAGYPASSHKGDVISGLAAAGALDDVTVYHAGTARQNGDVVTAGGRVLAVSALGDGFAAARKRAYEGVAAIHFDGQQTRTDIAERAVKAAAGELDLFPAGSAG